MSKTIQIKRGRKPGLPTLTSGELGYTTDTKRLYIGTDTGNEILTTFRLSATAPTFGWQLESSGDFFESYAQTISLSGIEDTNFLYIDLDLTDETYSNSKTLSSDFKMIIAYEALTDEIKLYANGLIRNELKLNVVVVK